MEVGIKLFRLRPKSSWIITKSGWKTEKNGSENRERTWRTKEGREAKKKKKRAATDPSPAEGQWLKKTPEFSSQVLIKGLIM